MPTLMSIRKGPLTILVNFTITVARNVDNKVHKLTPQVYSLGRDLMTLIKIGHACNCMHVSDLSIQYCCWCLYRLLVVVIKLGTVI